MRKLITITLTVAALCRAASSSDPAAAKPDLTKKITNKAPGLKGLRDQLDSINKQRLSIHQQLTQKKGLVGFSLDAFITPFPPLPLTDCPPLDAAIVDPLIIEAARNQALRPELIRAVIKQESAFKPCAVSVKGAQGLMQLMPATSQRFHISDAFNPAQNIAAGARFLKQLLIRYRGDLRLALVAYNAGSEQADRPANAEYPLETQNYVANILAELGVGSQGLLAEPGLDRQPEAGPSPQALPVEPPMIDLPQAPHPPTTKAKPFRHWI